MIIDMKSHLNSKVNPIMNQNIVRRERLECQIRENLDKKLILITSQAGSGKTTLISSILESVKVPPIFYSFDTSDKEISSFLYHFFSKIQVTASGFAKKFEKKKQLCDKDQIGPPTLLASLFVDELKQHLGRGKRLIIVLDNYEAVNSSLIINQFLEYVLKKMPPSLTFILSSSQSPNIDLSKHGTNGEIYQINGSDLAFNLDEIGELLSCIYHLDLPKEDLERIYKKTEGWITGLILLVQFLKMNEGTPIDDLLKGVNGYGKAISQYLMEHVFQNQTIHAQEFLCKTALLNDLTPDLCNLALNVKYSGKLLENLVNHNLFTFQINASSCRYHPLMREFLLEKLHENYGQEEIQIFQARLGEILSPIDPENAIGHFISARCFSKAVDLLRSIGEKMLREWRFKSLNEFLKSIPSPLIEGEPLLLYFLGRIAEIKGETDRAFECYEKSFHLFKGRKEVSNEISSLNRMAVIHIRQDRYEHAKDLLQNRIQCLESQGTEKDIALKLFTSYTNVSQVLIKLEERQKAESYLRKAENIYEIYPDPCHQVTLIQCQALKHLVEGNLMKGIELAEKAKSLSLELHLPTKTNIFYHYLAFGHLYLGHFSEGLDDAIKGLELAQRNGIDDNITGALFSDLGQIQYALSNYDQAMKALENSVAIFQRGQNICGNFWSNHALYHMALKLGDIKGAKGYLRNLAHLANQMGLSLEIGMAMMDQAYFSSLKGEGGVLELIEKGQGHLKKSIKRMSVFLAYLIATKAYFNLGEEGRAEALLLDSLTLLDGKNFYLFGIHQEKSWLPAFLQRFVSRIPQCEKLLVEYKNISDHSFGTMKEIGRDEEDIHRIEKGSEELLNLRIYSLGPFRIFIENEEIPLSRCKSKKAITLLRYLFFARHKGPVPKDILIELLWPESSPSQGDLNFRVTLSLLRKTLSIISNGRNHFPNLLRKRDGYQLCLGKEGWSDVDEFNNQMNLAQYKEKKENSQEAFQHYLNAENLYRGDFLVENLYEDWCYIEREHLKNQYLHALDKILDYHKGQHNLSEAINYCFKILKVDPYREDISRKLMQYHSELGNRREVRSVFEFCLKNIEDNLGLAVSYETKELYRKLSLSP
jgi:ATP/maltotriose-dependent transcriptional regulator MalT/DNA-binding SARP family transcriptional activator